MLILNRRVGETIRVGDDVTITVTNVRGSHVTLGINAPKTVPVHRDEIYQRLAKSGKTFSFAKPPTGDSTT